MNLANVLAFTASAIVNAPSAPLAATFDRRAILTRYGVTIEEAVAHLNLVAATRPGLTAHDRERLFTAAARRARRAKRTSAPSS